MDLKKPLIIITDKEHREEYLIDWLSTTDRRVYAIVLRNVENIEQAVIKLKSISKERGILLLAHGNTDNIKFCDGVHLNSKSRGIKEVRRDYGDQIIIGYSAHSVDEARLALGMGANYVFLSPVFKSKDSLSEPLGHEAFNRAVGLIGPGVFALGGVDFENAKLLSDKTTGIACISAIFDQRD